MSSSPTGSLDAVKKRDPRLTALLPWIILLLIAGGTFAALQLLVVKLLK
jgi:hypothetical protein